MTAGFSCVRSRLFDKLFYTEIFSMKVALYTLGCKLNYAETSTIGEQFRRAGNTIVPFGEPADTIIINTCSVTDSADAECRKIIRRALRVSPNAFIAVAGCYAQLKPEEIASIDGVDAVFGSAEKFSILKYVEKFEKFDTPKIFVKDIAAAGFEMARSADGDNRTRAFLKLQDGCDYSCSYCTIPMARGGGRSMDFADIEKQVRSLEAAGYQETVLTGINLGEYSAATGEKFYDAIKKIEELRPSFRLRISSIEPNLLKPEILALVAASDVFVPHFHIPLQSGSPEILRLMRRRYNTNGYADLIYRIKDTIPDCCIGVDVIAGFPGETDRHFQETFDFLHKLPVSYFHVFSYSERSDTPAAIYEGKVPAQIKRDRVNRLRALSIKKRHEFYMSQIGSVRTVVPETYDITSGRWTGWTENYVRVEFTADFMHGHSPTQVKLCSIEGENVLGEITDIANENAQSPRYIPLLAFSE